MSPSPYVATSPAQTIVGRLQRTHDRTRISVFSGPPGIGKTTAILRFKERNYGSVCSVQLGRGPRSGMRAVAAMQAAAEACAELIPSKASYLPKMPGDLMQLRTRIWGMVSEWSGVNDYARYRASAAMDDPPLKLSLVIDEAQYLHPDAIDALRALNDVRGGFSPFPIAVNFVGNNAFVLKSEGRTQSVLEDQVRDRLLYTEVLSYGDVTDADLAIFFQDRGLVDPGALGISLKHFASGRVNRSFRRAEDLLTELEDEAAGEPITIHTLSVVLGLA